MSTSDARDRAGLERLCVCGCGRAQRPGSKYFDYERCRQRTYRQRVGRAAADAGLPTSLTLASLSGSSGSRLGDAQKGGRAAKRRRPDLRVSYRKAVDAVDGALAEIQPYPTAAARRRVMAALEGLLTDRQREALGS